MFVVFFCTPLVYIHLYVDISYVWFSFCGLVNCVIKLFGNQYRATVCMPGCEPITVDSFGFLFNCTTVGQATEVMKALA